MKHALIIVIEDVPGSVDAGTIRENAEALAHRLGGTVSAAHPITPVNPPSVLTLLRRVVARMQTRAALTR